MKIELKQQLQQAGIDVDTSLERLMGRDDMLFRFLKKFPADASYQQLVEAIAAGDTEQAFQAAHTLKGVAGNLGLCGVMQPLVPFVETLRDGSLDGAEQSMREITTAYWMVCDEIALLD